MARVGTLNGFVGVMRSGQDKWAAFTLVAVHSLQHAYQHGFYVILPVIYTAMGLTPVSAGAIETVRRFAMGIATMGGGVLVDQLQHRRFLILYLSVASMGLGYLLIGLAPTYALVLVAVALAGAAGSIWHPAAISLLSQRYPEHRGLLISFHRSAGSVGDTVGPIVFGILLAVLLWQVILYAAFPIALVLAVLLSIVLRRASTWQGLQHRESTERRPLGEQFRTVWQLFRHRRLLIVLLVSGTAGLGQGGLLLWVPLYLSETQQLSTALIGFHVALLTGIGIVTSPVFGGLSDRIGRKPVILTVLTGKMVIAALMALTGSGVLFTLTVALMGAFMFGVNSLVQAAALDVGEGKKVEGTLIGVLYGNNALFVGAAPLFIGFLVANWGFNYLFWYIAAMNALALSIAVLLPAMGRPTQAPAQS